MYAMYAELVRACIIPRACSQLRDRTNICRSCENPPTLNLEREFIQCARLLELSRIVGLVILLVVLLCKIDRGGSIGTEALEKVERRARFACEQSQLAPFHRPGENKLPRYRYCLSPGEPAVFLFVEIVRSRFIPSAFVVRTRRKYY